MINHINRSQTVHAALARVWDFFSNPANLDALTPPDLAFRIAGPVADKMYAGQLIEYRIRFLPGLWSRWLTEIAHVEEGRYFVDEQRMGPYKFWYHQHSFIETAAGIEIIDQVTYDIGFGALGWLVDRIWVRRKLAHIFDYRHKMVETEFTHSTDRSL